MLGGAVSATAPAVRQAVRLRTDSLYRVMRAALARGDWAGFGRAFDALGTALGQRAP
jgi:hypothetical protein